MVDKVVDDLNQIWVEQDGEAVRIGFTRTFLNTLDQCWHILPANNKQFKRKSPLITVETNDGLISILSPVDGFLQQFDKRAQNFPDRLTENDVILHLTTKAAVVVPRAVPREGFGLHDNHPELPVGFQGAANADQVQAIIAERGRRIRELARQAPAVDAPRRANRVLMDEAAVIQAFQPFAAQPQVARGIQGGIVDWNQN